MTQPTSPLADNAIRKQIYDLVAYSYTAADHPKTVDAIMAIIQSEGDKREVPALRIVWRTIVDNDVAGPVKWQVEDMIAQLKKKVSNEYS